MATVINNIIQENIRRQSPLLWFAIPGALGLACAGGISGFSEFASFFMVLGILSGALCINALLFDKPLLAKIAFSISVFCAAAFYFSYRHPANPYPDWNTRDAGLVLRINRADTNAKGACYGFGEVLEAPPYFEKAKGMAVWFYINGTAMSRGDTISADFTVRKVDGADGFNGYLNSKKIYFTINTRGLTEIRKGTFPYSFYNRCRDYISENLSIFNNPEDAFKDGARAYRAMILGDKSELSPDAKTSFSSTGTMHIFAISGLHVGLIAGSVYALLNIVRIPRKIQPFICLPVLFLYVNACGARPSAMRAFMMIAIVWVAISFLRKPKPFAGFTSAFCISFLIAPSDIFDAGFALSYAVVAAILLYAVPFYDYLKGKLHGNPFEDFGDSKWHSKITDYILAAFAISFAAIFASAPLSSAYFGYIAPLALPFSIVYVAMASVVVTLGLAAMILPAFVTVYTNNAAAFITQLMLDGAKIGAESGLVINVKISGIAAFLIESALVCILLIYHRIPTAWKWSAFPAAAVVGVLIAAIF